MGAELFHAGRLAEGWEDFMKLIQAFHNPMNEPKSLHTHKCDCMRLWNLTSYLLWLLKSHLHKFYMHTFLENQNLAHTGSYRIYISLSLCKDVCRALRTADL
jgi:hypothetical protein